MLSFRCVGVDRVRVGLCVVFVVSSDVCFFLFFFVCVCCLSLRCIARFACVV